MAESHIKKPVVAVGPNTVEAVKRILASRKYEVQTYRMCQGVLGFARKYGRPALEETCKQALEYGKVTYTFVKNRIPAVAEDMGVSNVSNVSNENRTKNEDRNKGAFVMDAQSMDIDSLLSRSQNLAFGKRKGGDK